MNYLDLAAKLALADINSNKNYLLAAVCIRADGAIVTASNILTQTPDGSAHAEYRVLRKGGYGSILYVARITRDGQRANSKPCAKCMSLICNKHVKKVYYTINNNEFGVIKF